MHVSTTARYHAVMKNTNDAGDEPASLQILEARLTRTLGVVVGGAALSRALGYPSQGAFRQAFARNRLPVQVFEIEGRRGRFAKTSDIARWLWTQGAQHLAGPGRAALDRREDIREQGRAQPNSNRRGGTPP